MQRDTRRRIGTITGDPCLAEPGLISFRASGDPPGNRSGRVTKERDVIGDRT